MAFGDVTESLTYDSNGVSGTTMTVTFTSAPNENDLIVLIPFCTASSLTAPGGFTEAVDGDDTTNSYAAGIYYKLAGASEGTTFACTAGSSVNDRVMIGIVYEGPFAASPLDANQLGDEETGSGSIECPKGQTITTTVNDTLLVAAGWLTHTSAISGESPAMAAPVNGYTYRTYEKRNTILTACADQVLTSTVTGFTECKINIGATAWSRNRGGVAAFAKQAAASSGGLLLLNISMSGGIQDL